jgi:hypothetical protein
MRKLTFIVLCVAALYAGYWAMAKRGLDAALDSTITAAEGLGWQIDYADLNTAGFPSRFDMTAQDFQITSPDGSFAYQAPFVQTFALSYRPNQIIAVFPPVQTMRVGPEDAVIATDNMRARVALAANTALDLRSFTAEGAAVKLKGNQWQASVETALIGVKPDGPAANTYAAYINLNGVALPSLLGMNVKDATFVLDGRVTLDRPLDRFAVANWMVAPPAIEQINVTSLDVTFGNQHVSGIGDLVVDTTGMPTGQIDLKMTGWRDILALLVEAGVVDQGRVPLITGIVGMLSGPDGAVNLPLLFQNGQMLLGPVPLGPSPRFR